MNDEIICNHAVYIPEILQAILDQGIFNFHFWKDQFKHFKGFEATKTYVMNKDGSFSETAIKVPVYQITMNCDVNFGNHNVEAYLKRLGFSSNIIYTNFNMYTDKDQEIIVGQMKKLAQLRLVCKTWNGVVIDFIRRNKSKLSTRMQLKFDKK